jgi:hypothetical protein
MEYPRCPRCLSPWKQIDFCNITNELTCLTKCGMMYYPGSPTLAIYNCLVLESIIVQKDILLWNINEKNCAYAKSDSLNKIYLPWLKFDITCNKLKKYLLFL